VTPVLVEVAKAADVPEGEARRIEVNGAEIAVVNLGGGEFRAVDDICSHEHYHLSEGEVDTDDETIECPKHGSTFDLDTGRPRSLPATRPVRTFPVKVEGDSLLIELED
jgi:3-phenylpropionate/trans-cinnamate dioxygenase ferredoxin subunit